MSRANDELHLTSPRSQRSFATARPHSVLDGRRDSPLRGWPSRSSNVGSTYARPDSRSDFDRFQSGSRRREFPTRNRPESMLETNTERDRYDASMSTPSRMRFAEADRSAHLNALIGTRGERGDRVDRGDGTYRGSGDFSLRMRDLGAEAPRTPLSPNDSVSVVGSRADVGSGRKDPLDIIRRLEETRANSQRRWEEDRSMSVLGDRSPSVYERSRYGEREVLARPASRVEDNGRSSSRMSSVSRIRHSASMMSVASHRESSVYGTPRTQPLTRQRTHSGEDGSVADSPLLGRTSRASGSISGSVEPRIVRRSQTSMGSKSTGSSGNEALATEHGKNLVDAAKVLDRKLEFDPGIITRLTAAAGTGERANAGIRAAAAIAGELALDVELHDGDALELVRERLPRLAVTLKEAGRSSDQAVRDLTDAILAIRGHSGGQGVGAPNRATATPQRRADSMYVTREPASEPLHRRGWSTTIDTPLSRHSTYSTLPHSPSARLSLLGGRETPRVERSSTYESATPTSASRHETNSRFDGPRSLDPIQQSPPRPPSHHTSPSSGQRESFRLTSPPPRTERAPSRQMGHSRRSLDRVFAPAPSPATTPQPQQQPQERPEPHGTSGPAHSPPVLRKQASVLSTHTVRAHSFVPSAPPEPTTAISNSPAYSQPSLPHRNETEEARPAHAKKDSISSTSSQLSRNGDPVFVAQGSPEVHVQRSGTFGAAEGAKMRESVSERFRKHLTGEHA